MRSLQITQKTGLNRDFFGTPAGARRMAAGSPRRQPPGKCGRGVAPRRASCDAARAGACTASRFTGVRKRRSPGRRGFPLRSSGGHQQPFLNESALLLSGQHRDLQERVAVPPAQDSSPSCRACSLSPDEICFVAISCLVRTATARRTPEAERHDGARCHWRGPSSDRPSRWPRCLDGE